MELTTSERKRISSEAAIWLSVLEECPSKEQRSGFLAWLEKSPWHTDIFLAVAAHFSDVLLPDEVVEPAHEVLEPDIPTWIARPADPRPSIHSRRSQHARIAACVALFLLAGALLYWAWPDPSLNDRYLERMTYTDAGTFQLGKSSTMTLDSQSRAEVVKPRDSSETRVHVIEGHVAFSGTHDSSALLRVVSNNVAVDVLGTSFDVYHERGATTVKVTQGRVHVASYCQSPGGMPVNESLIVSGQKGSEVDLRDGQTVKVPSDNCSGSLEVRAVQDATVQQVVNAPDGWLEFTNGTVEEAVQEFNRNSPDRIIVSDPDLGNRRIAGRFRSSEVESFLKILARDFNARVRRSTASDGSKVIYLSLSTRK